MAITYKQVPSGYTPASNSQRFVASSTNTAQPNFAFTVVVTDNVTSTSKTYQVAPHPVTSQCVWDAQPYVERFIDHYIPINLYGWQKSTGIRQITVNIGETYGPTGSVVYHVGVDYIYKVWNAVVDYLEYPIYDQENYKYDARTIQLNYLSSLLDVETFEDRSDYLYALTTQVGDILTLKVMTYDSAGSVLGEYEIDNPYEASVNYREKYLCIDVGYKGMANIFSGDVTVVSGALPIVDSTVAYYEIYDISISISPPQGNVTLLKTITVGCEPRFDVYTLHYLRKNGAFETIHFTKKSEENITTSRTTYGKIPFTHVADSSTYTRSTPVQNLLDSKTQKTLRLNTDWLNPAAIAIHQEILDSTIIYLDQGSTLDYPVLACVKSSYKISKRFDSLAQINLDFEFTHENYRQR